MTRFWLGLAAASGVAAVAADALARHVADGIGGESAAIGARYGLVHAAALLALIGLIEGYPGLGGAARRLAGVAGWCFALGLVLFPGSLYLLALGGPPLVARLTPIGGTLFILGWVALLAAALVWRRPG